jgi:hypothetical protein
MFPHQEIPELSAFSQHFRVKKWCFFVPLKKGLRETLWFIGLGKKRNPPKVAANHAFSAAARVK